MAKYKRKEILLDKEFTIKDICSAEHKDLQSALDFVNSENTEWTLEIEEEDFKGYTNPEIQGMLYVYNDETFSLDTAETDFILKSSPLKATKRLVGRYSHFIVLEAENKGFCTKELYFYNPEKDADDYAVSDNESFLIDLLDEFAEGHSAELGLLLEGNFINGGLLGNNVSEKHWYKATDKFEAWCAYEWDSLIMEEPELNSRPVWSQLGNDQKEKYKESKLSEYKDFVEKDSLWKICIDPLGNCFEVKADSFEKAKTKALEQISIVPLTDEE